MVNAPAAASATHFDRGVRAAEAARVPELAVELHTLSKTDAAIVPKNAPAIVMRKCVMGFSATSWAASAAAIP